MEHGEDVEHCRYSGRSNVLAYALDLKKERKENIIHYPNLPSLLKIPSFKFRMTCLCRCRNPCFDQTVRRAACSAAAGALAATDSIRLQFAVIPW